MFPYEFSKNLQNRGFFKTSVNGLATVTKAVLRRIGFIYGRVSVKIYFWNEKKTNYNIVFVTKLFENDSLCEKCPYSEFCRSVFSRIHTEYREILRIPLYSARMLENTGLKNSKYGHFSRSDFLCPPY